MIWFCRAVCLVVGACLYQEVSVASAASEQPGTVIVLTNENFEHQTQASTGQTTGKWFVDFYAPWCGHCVKLEPIWNELAADLAQNHAEQGILLAKVDSTVNRDLAKRFQVRSYPTLKYFANHKVYTYTGERTLDALKEFVLSGYQNETGEKVPLPPSWWEVTSKKISDSYEKTLKSNRELAMLADDFKHIVAIRKNAAAVLVAIGLFIGLIMGCCLGKGSRKSKSKQE
jgi:protein disulfide-isomerase-like protein